MKKSITGYHNYSSYILFFLISFLSGTSDSLAQNTFDNSGTNVGIGTTNPSKRLHLANLGSNNGIQFDSKFRLRTSDVSNNHFVFENLTSNGSIYFRGGGTLGKLILNDQGGNVGIGTTSPSEKLQIENGIVKIRNNNNTNRFIWSRTDNTMLAGLAGDGARKMFLIANNATRMTIDGNTGYVGIGTSSPTEKLDVNEKSKS